MTGVISYPIPPYQNPPIEPQYFIPSRFVISAISQGQLTTITTSVNHNYVLAQQVRVIIPPGYGMYQINGMTGLVQSIPNANQVVLNIDSTFFDAFVAASLPNQPQILAIGDINFGFNNIFGKVTLGTHISGSFINISPN